MNRWISLFISLFVLGSFSMADPIAFPILGNVQPKHARDIQASNWSVGAETMDRDYTIYKNWKDYLGPLGFKKARIQGGWAKTEPRKGQYRWDWLDEILLDMPTQGVTPWVCLCYSNPVYNQNDSIRLGAGLPSTPEALAAWDQWVAAFVQRYKTVVTEWEVWNEPNLRNANSTTHYAAFFIRTAEIIKNIQPNATIVGLSMAGVRTDFTEEVLLILKQEDKLHLLDKVTYHPYKPNPDQSYSEVEKLKDAIATVSDRIQIFQGENGCPSSFRKTKALSNYPWTERSQAKWALRRLLGDLGRDIESSYFSIMDMKYPDEMNTKGLLRSNDDQTVASPKQSYYALQNLAAIFDDSLHRVQDFTFTTNASRSVTAFAFKNKNRPVIPIWFGDQTPSDSNQKTWIDITFDHISFKKPVYVDLRTGIIYEIPEECITTSGTFQGIPVYDSPILIAEKRCIPIQ
jgi:hypothetical protein